MKSRVLDITLIALLSCFALFLVVPHMNNSIWYDEACTVDFAGLPFHSLIDMLAAGNNMPAYYLFMRVWTSVFGIGEAALRVPGVIFYILSVVCVYFFGKRLFSGRGPAFASALIYLLLRINTDNAVNARPYGMLALLSIASLMLFYELFIVGKNNRLLAAAFIAVNIIGSFTHLWFFFTALYQAVYYMAVKRRLDKRFTLVFLYSFAGFFILWVPVLYSQLHSTSNSWMAFNGNEIEVTLRYFMAGRLYSVFFLSLIPVLAGFLKKMYEKKGYNYKPYMTNTFFILTVLIVSLIVPFIISFFKPIYIVERGPMITAAPFALLLGGFLCAISYRPLFYAALSLFSLFIYIKLYSAGAVNYLNDRTLAKLAISNAADVDNISFYSELKRPMKYYFKLYNFNRSVRFTDLPEKIADPGGAEGGVRLEAIDQYYDSLSKGKKLLYVFTDADAKSAVFNLIYARLNKTHRVIKKAGCAGITLVKYSLTEKP